MFHALREPPAKGSLRESILLLYVMRERNITFMRDLALAQVVTNKKYDVFEELQKEMFPWMETTKNREKVDHIKKLMSEVKQGPLTVSAQKVPSVKSRLGKQVKRILLTDEKRKEQDDLYKKMGSMF